MSEADRYRLGPVRDARAREERVRRGDLASAASDARATQAKLDAASTRVTDARAALDAAREAHRELVARGSISATLVRAEQFVERRRRELEAARDAHARVLAVHRGQLEVVDAARERLARARADKELVERHFARWRDERKKLAERREE